MPSENEIAPEEYLTSGEVMTLINISRRTLERYVASSKLQVVYLPSGHRRYAKSEVDALLTPGRAA